MTGGVSVSCSQVSSAVCLMQTDASGDNCLRSARSVTFLRNCPMVTQTPKLANAAYPFRRQKRKRILCRNVCCLFLIRTGVLRYSGGKYNSF